MERPSELTLSQRLRERGCVLQYEALIVLDDRRVTSEYIQVDPILTDPVLLLEIASLLVNPFLGKFDVVAAPATGGIALVYSAPKQIDGKNIKTVFGDKNNDGEQKLSREHFQEIVKGKRVLVLEDVANSGTAALQLGNEIVRYGGSVVGYSFIWNRSYIQYSDMGAPVHSLIREWTESFVPSEHPMYGTWPLATDVGHPEFLELYPGPKIKILS